MNSNINEKISLSQLEQYLSKAAWILKGPVDASDFKVYIFPLLFFKRISDVYDEEYQNALEESQSDEEYAALPEFHRFVIPEGCHWEDVRATTTNVGLAIEKALRGIEQANQEFLYGIFGDAQWSNKNKLSDRLLIDLIEHFSQYLLANSTVEPDMLGQAYEYLIKQFAALTNKKAGEFYTPRSVVHLLGLLLDPSEGESIYDPACGAGGMLLECVDHLKTKQADYRTLKLYGQEKNLTSSSILKQKHIDKIFKAYQSFSTVENFAALVDVEEVLKQNGNMAINLYVRPATYSEVDNESFESVYKTWEESSATLKKSMGELFKTLEVNGKCWVNNHTHVLRIKGDNRYIVKEYFNFHDIKDYITGGTRPKITKGMLNDIPVFLPKKDLRFIFEKILLAIDESIGLIQSKITTSKSLPLPLINQII